MPNYQYKVKEEVDNEFVDKIVDINFSMKYVGNEQDLPQEVVDKISYVDENGLKIIGTRVISPISLNGFDNNGTSRNSR